MLLRQRGSEREATPRMDLDHGKSDPRNLRSGLHSGLWRTYATGRILEEDVVLELSGRRQLQMQGLRSASIVDLGEFDPLVG